MGIPLDARAAPLLMPGYLAPAVDLLLAAVKPSQTLPTVLSGPWSALALSAFEERYPAARYVVLESMPPPALAPVVTTAQRAYGRALPCPLKAHTAGTFVQALAGWDAASDAVALRECTRTLRPGGVFAGAFLMRGSFDAFFDAAREVCEAEALMEAAGVLQQAEAQFRAPDLLRALAARSGLVEVEVGLEERGIPFADAKTFLTDAAVGSILLRHVGVADEASRGRLFQAVETALDTYFAGMGVTARVVTGVVRGVKPAD